MSRPFVRLDFSPDEIEQIIGLILEKINSNDVAIAEYLKDDNYDRQVLRGMFMEQGKLTSYVNYMKHVVNQES